MDDSLKRVKNSYTCLPLNKPGACMLAQVRPTSAAWVFAIALVRSEGLITKAHKSHAQDGNSGVTLHTFAKVDIVAITNESRR